MNVQAGPMMPIRAGAGGICVNPGGKAAVRGSKQFGSLDLEILRKVKPATEISGLHGRIGFRIPFREPNPLSPLNRSPRVRPRHPIRMRLELLPGQALEKSFRQTELPRAGKIHSLVPRDDAVAAAVR